MARLARCEPVWVVVGVFAAVMQLRWWWPPGGDASNYLAIARSLAHGALSARGDAYLHHLPGYSLLIAPAFWLGNRPFFFISLIHLGLALLLIWALLRWLRPMIGPTAGLVMAFVLTSAGLWELWQMTQSEVAFVPMLVVSALAIRRMLLADSWKRWALWVVVAALCVTFTGMIRHAGVLLVGGLAISGLMLAWRGQASLTRAVLGGLIVAVVAASVVGGWMLREKAVAEQVRGHYSAIAAAGPRHGETKLEQMVESGRMRIGEAGRLTVPGMIKVYARQGEWLHYNTLIFCAINICLLIGWWLVAKRHADPFLWSLPFLLALNIFYAGDAGTRYTVPLLPIIAVSVWSFLRLFASLGRDTLVVIVIAHLIVAMVYWVQALEDVSLGDHWDDVDRIAASLPAKPKEVGVMDLDKKHYAMLQVELDTKIRRLDAEQPVPEEMQWLITGEGTPVPAEAQRVEVDAIWEVYRLPARTTADP